MIFDFACVWLCLGVLFWCLVDTFEMKKRAPYSLMPDQFSLGEKRAFMVLFCGLLWMPLVIKAAIDIVVGVSGAILHLTIVVGRYLYLNVRHWRRRKDISIGRIQK